MAQSTVLEKAWSTSQSTNGLGEMETRIDKLVTKLERHRYRNDQHKLYALFKSTHSTFLYQYSQYSDIDELTNGKYDCLTATALFADVLDRAGYRYNIIETNYHIFVVVKTASGDVILETTDRSSGFINDTDRIGKTIAAYRKNTLQAATPSHYQYSFSLYQTVDVDQLAGLLYFNQAVKAFNAQKWDECSEKLSAASKTIRSPRVDALAELLRQQQTYSAKK